MRIWVLLVVVMMCGCTVLAKDEYMAVSDPSGYEHYDFQQLDCYETEGLEVCSRPFKSKSLMIGVVVLIWPQFSRGRLSYDIERDRSVRVRNTSEGIAKLVLFSSAAGCEDEESSITCAELDDFERMPSESVWMKLPKHDGLEIRTDFEGKESIIQLRTKTRLNIHAVSV